MRVPPGAIGGILRDPSSTAVILFYGEDLGLVHERAVQVTRAVLGDTNDPFRLSILARDEHGRVLEEATAMAMTGGRRVVRVLDAGDALTPILSRLAENEKASLLVLEGGALPTRSKLRALVEKRKAWAAIACYPASSAAIASEIREIAGAAGCAISPDITQALVGLLPGDTAARASELQKLITYAGPGGRIDADALLACGGETAEMSMSTLFEAVLNGDIEEASMLTERVFDDGTTGPSLIAAFGAHLQRVLKVRLLVDAGSSAESSCAMLLPPVFPRQVAALCRQVRAWSSFQLMQMLASLRSADEACKRAGSRDSTIGSYLMLVAARRAARRDS